MVTVYEVTAKMTSTAIESSVVLSNLYAGQWQHEKIRLQPGEAYSSFANHRGFRMEKDQFYADTPAELLDYLFSSKKDGPLSGWHDADVTLDESGHHARMRTEKGHNYLADAPYHIQVVLDIQYQKVCSFDFSENGDMPMCGTNEDGSHWSWYGNHDQGCKESE